MDLQVVGAGSMGRWVARALAADASELVTVTFVDADPSVASAASDTLEGTNGCTVTAGTGSEPAAAEVVCVAVPIQAATEAIAEAADRAEAAILDLTGTMAEPVETMAVHAADLERLSLHPLFAPESEPGNVAAVPVTGGPVTDLVRETLTARGNEWFETTPAAHDEAMETVQARTHAAVLAFALAREDVEDRFHTPISGPLSDLADQVTDGDARVYADVQAAFDGAEDVAAAARRLAEADEEAFGTLYEDAGR
ncbi:MAG: prephenate dehydrogenase/arogenate dehydrogenase family protein [Haloarculaceae archaeon]